ncbi:MAG: hypothetical protein AAF585_10405 [Verrucomicrobiota bacterium]
MSPTTSTDSATSTALVEICGSMIDDIPAHFNFGGLSEVTAHFHG